MKKFFSFVAAVLFAGSVMADWSVIQFTADAAKGTLNDSVFAVNGFSLKLTDTDNNKLQIDANPASFGSVESRDDYSYRLKTGGKSSSKNNLTLTLPEAGTVRIAVRTGSNADATRTVVAVQGEDTLSNRVAQEADTIVGVTSPRIYYYHEFEAEAGVVNITYPVNSVNFYAFAFEAATVTPAGTTCAEVYNMAKNDVIDLLNPVTVTFANGKNVWVKDETASMLIFLPAASEAFKAGDVLSNIAGVVDVYNGIHEVKPSAAQVDAIVIAEGEAPAAEEVETVAATDVNKYIVMKGIAFETAAAFEEGSQQNLVINDVTVRNQFKNGFAFEAGKIYDIYGVVTLYQNNPQVYFISAEEAGDVPPTPSINYYVAGSMGVWGPDEAYRLTPNNQGLYEGEFTFAANDEFKVIGYDGTTVTWFPEGMDNNFKITEAGDYKITFNPAGNVDGWYAGFFNVVKKEVPIVHQYEVAEAIAAGLADDTEILVRGVITKMEIKGKNFAKYGSVNIYVADATGAEGEFEFYNCYSLNADTFRTTTPAYDATSTAWAQLEEVVDGNGNTIQLGDTVIAFGKYKLFNTTHELNTGCYLVDVKHAEAEPIVIANLTYGEVYTEYFAEWGAVDVLVTNQPIVGQQIVGDGYMVAFDILPENANNITGTYSALAENLDLEYSGITQIAGTDTIKIELADGVVAFQVVQTAVEQNLAQLAMAAELVDVDGNIYHVEGACVVYYEFLPEEQGVENVAAEQKKAIKKIEMGNVVIEKNGVRYNVNGAIVR